MSRILERKYLVQQAIAAKLDREPTVLLDLLRSREQILAGAYVQRDLGSKVAAISKSEVDAYIEAHPDKFAKRRLFQIEQVSFPPQKDMESLAAATKDFKSMDQVEAKLNDLGIKYSRGPAAVDGATLPSEMLKPLEARKPDDIFFIRSKTSASFFKVTSVDDRPLTGDEANQFAKRELASDLAKEEAQATSAAALAGAKYEGDYARIMTAATPAAAAAGGEAPAGEAQTLLRPERRRRLAKSERNRQRTDIARRAPSHGNHVRRLARGPFGRRVSRSAEAARPQASRRCARRRRRCASRRSDWGRRPRSR